MYLGSCLSAVRGMVRGIENDLTLSVDIDNLHDEIRVCDWPRPDLTLRALAFCRLSQTDSMDLCWI